MNQIKLSILIPSVYSRRNTFLPRILNEIDEQYEKLSNEQKEQVEILTFIDNKKIMLGDKRNLMIDQAQGAYVVFVDDDDRLSKDYIVSLLEATNSGADVITFKAEVSLNNSAPKICIYSKDYDKDYNTEQNYHRLPNHICCVKKEIAERVQFPSIIYGEDSAYAKMLKPLLKSQYFIDKVLYYYDYNSETTETQTHQRTKRNYKKPRVHIPYLLDLIILSDAKTEKFADLTEQTIITALTTAKDYKINVIVMEGNPEYSYWDTTTFHYNYEFNYNKVANQGIRMGSAPYVMIANNDLIFKEDWLFHLFASNHNIVSPKCPHDKRQTELTQNTLGYEVGKHFSGWCFMMKRAIWEEIGGFDEDFHFWFADNSVVEQVKKKGYQPMLVPKAIVEHLGSQTLKTLDEKQKHNNTRALIEKFNKKYNQNLFRK